MENQERQISVKVTPEYDKYMPVLYDVYFKRYFNRQLKKVRGMYGVDVDIDDLRGRLSYRYLRFVSNWLEILEGKRGNYGDFFAYVNTCMGSVIVEYFAQTVSQRAEMRRPVDKVRWEQRKEPTYIELEPFNLPFLKPAENHILYLAKALKNEEAAKKLGMSKRNLSYKVKEIKERIRKEYNL